MDRRVFDFLELAPRSKKPRSRGLTTILDEGDPLSWVREMLSTYEEYVDGVKFALTCLTMPWSALEQRVKVYRDFNLHVALDDPTFAIAYHQGKADQLLRAVRDTGFTHVQIDTKEIISELDHNNDDRKAEEDELYYMNFAQQLGLKVEGEVGKKWPEGDPARKKGGLLNVEYIVKEIRRLLAAGCDHVYLESLVIREAIGECGEKEEGTQQIRQIAKEVGPDNIFIETGRFQLPWETRQCHRFWAVRNFGPDVNMGGNEPLVEIPFIEAIRRGFLFVPGPSRSTPRLWVKSLVKNGGRAAEDWWNEEYPIDLELVKKRYSS